MNLKTALVLALTVIALAVGNMSLSRGMKEMGEVSIRSVGDVLRLLLVVFRNRSVAIGVLLLALHFYSLLSLLSWADVSYILPLTSLQFILGTVLARFVLHEEVTNTRWLGTLIICLGVALVASGEAKTKKQEGRSETAIAAGPVRME